MNLRRTERSVYGYFPFPDGHRSAEKFSSRPIFISFTYTFGVLQVTKSKLALVAQDDAQGAQDDAQGAQDDWYWPPRLRRRQRLRPSVLEEEEEGLT